MEDPAGQAGTKRWIERRCAELDFETGANANNRDTPRANATRKRIDAPFPNRATRARNWARCARP